MTKKSPILDNPPRIKILKDTVPTHLEEIQRESKKTPGPGKYETKKKVKIYGTYTYKETGCTFTNEAQFRGMSTPSHYTTVDLEKTKDRCPKFRYSKPLIDGPLTNRIGKIP